MSNSFSRLDSNLHVAGNLSAETMDIPSGSIINADVAATAAIGAEKLVHRFPVRYSQNQSAVVADAIEGIHIAAAAGTIASIEVACTSSAPVGDSTVTVDLEKSTGGGAFASVLSSAITLDNANTVRVLEAGTVSSPAYADGDILRINVNATVGTGTLPTGLVATVTLQENPS